MLSLYHFFKSGALTMRIKTYAWRAFSFLFIAALGTLATVTAVSAARLYLPSLSPTKTDAIIGDYGDGKADPGEIIEYTVVIPNAGPDPATNVTFSDLIDPNTTLVTGSIHASPIASNDTYDAIGNTLLRVGGTAGNNPEVFISGGSVRSNDAAITDTASVVTITSGTTTLGGTVNLSSDGTFTYMPPAGVTGADSFTYTLRNDADTSLINTATVTINVSSRIWYVNSAGTNGNGTSSSPFNILSAATVNGAGGSGDVDGAGDYIYLFASGTNYTGGIILENNQKLIGEGVALIVSGNTLRSAGTAPALTNTSAGGNGVSATNISNAEIRGLQISGNTNAIDITTAVTLAAGSSFEIANNTILSAGAEGVDVNFNAGTIGTSTVSIHDNTVTSTGNGIDIQSTAGTVYITAFDDNVVTGETGGTGINIANVTFDANTSTAGFQQVSGGSTTIGQAGNGVGAAGGVFTSVQGNLFFSDLDIVAGGGAGLRVAGTGSGMTLGISPSVATVAATGGPSVDVTSVAITLPFVDIDSTTSATTGVALNSVTGTFSAGAGSSIANITSAAGTAFQVGSSNVTVTYDGTLSTTTGKGVDLTNNTGSTITFRGGISFSSGSQVAFNATGGGTVNVCDENPCNPAATGTLVNSLTATTGTALNIVNTTIGANDLEFRSIASDGAASGIILDNTGASGNLVVKGDSGGTNNSSGGTIQNTTSHGISLRSTLDISLDQMTIQSTEGSGINGVDVTSFTFTNGTINNSGDALGESNIAFNGNGTKLGNNLDGVLTITGSTLTNAYDSGIHVENDNGTLSNAMIQNNTITSSTSIATSKGGGIQLIGTGNASTVGNLDQATISGNTIRNFPSGAGIQVLYGNANTTGPGGHAGIPGGGLVSITNNVARGFDATNRFGTHAILFVVSGGNSASRSQGNFNVSNNGTVAEPIGNSLGIALGVGNNGYSDMVAAINNNVIVANNTVGSGGISGGNGTVTGTNTETPHLVLTVTNNNISQTDGNGILLVGRGTSGLAEFGIRNNTVAAPLTGVRPGIRVDAGNASSGNDNICLNISGNTAGGSGGHEGIGLRKQGTSSTLNAFGVQGMTATSSPGIENFVGNTGQNPGAASGSFGTNGVLLISATSGFSNCSTTAFQSQDTQTLAKAQPSKTGAQVSEAAPVVNDATAEGANLATANILTMASGSANGYKLTSQVQPGRSSLYVSNNPGNGKPLFIPAPRRSGETVTVPTFTLPAGETVTIKFRVTVDALEPGEVRTQISSQATVDSDELPAVLSDDPAAGGGSDPTITLVDRPDTTVVSIDRDGVTQTNASSVSWTVTFAQPVAGLTSSNFTLVNGGLGGSPALSGVTAIGGAPASQWTVTASTGTGDGTLGLNMTSDTSLSHDVTNVPFTGLVYTIDNTPPTVTIDSIVPNPSNTDTEIVWHANESGNLIARLGGIDCTTGELLTSTPYSAPGSMSVTVPLAALSEGANTIRVCVTDAAVNTGSTTGILTRDTTAPTITVNNPSTTPATSKTITASTSEGTLAMSNTTGSICDDTLTFTAYSSQTFSLETDNGTRVCYRAMDALGNTAYSLSNAIAGIDVTPPDTTIGSYPANPSNSANAFFTFSGTDNVTLPASLTFQCSMDSGAFGTCPASYTGLANGNHAFQVRAVDGVGNIDPTPAIYTWVVDTTPPDTIIQPPLPANPTNITTASFTYDGSDNVGGSGVAAFQCAFDGAAFTPCSSPMPQNYTGLSDGSHTFQVRARDNAGNLDPTSASYTWVVDTSGPTVTMTSTASDPTHTSPIPVTVQFSESVTDFVAGDIQPINGTVNNFIIVDGDTYTFNLAPSGQGLVSADIATGVAVDAAGNGNTAATQFSRTYDTVEPTVTINRAAGQTDPTSVSPINFTVIFSEPVTDFVTGDVTLSGAGATTGTVTEIAPMNGTTYNVAVSGMTSGGTVVATLNAGVAQDAASNGNAASTSTENTVAFTFNSTTGLISSVNPAIAGQTITFTATVTSTGGTPIGTVEFREGTVVLGTGTLNASGQATFNTTLTLGTYNISAYYLGSVNHNASNSAPVTQVIDLANTATTVATSGSPSGFGAPVTFTATVTVVAPGAGTPTGTVQFFNGGTSLGTGTLSSGGQATLTTSSLTTGSHTITATYGGDPNFNGSTSSGITQVIDGPPNVDLINSVADTGDGQIVENERTNAAITQLLVVFNKDMKHSNPLTGDDVLNSSNYQLTPEGLPDININNVAYNNNGGAGPFIVTLSLNGAVPLSDGGYTLTIEGDIEDTLGAPIGADFVRNFYIDRTPPILNSFTRQNPASSPTNAHTLIFRATFSEDVQNVNTIDFAASGTTATITNVSAVNNSVYDITVSGGDLVGLDGTVGLNLSPAQDITDIAGNPLPSGEPTIDQTYNVYKTGPGAATLVSPTGNIGTSTPTYTWDEVSGATWYYLWINDPSGNILKQWYEGSAVCSSGSCSVVPAGLTLSASSHTWRIQTWNSVGYGPWSDEMSFSHTPPAKTTLVSPTGSTSDTTPTYTWDEVSGATWYYLWVNGPSGNVIKQWYDASVICSEGTCSVTPTTTLVSGGAHSWWVQTWNSAGYGPWSYSMSFTPFLLGKATLVSPTGNIGTSTPTYTWDEVSGTTWYYLYVNGPSGNVIKQWYEVSAICSGGTCSVTPTTALSAGVHRWRVQTYNSAGYGPWSDEMNFTVAVPGKAILTAPTGSIADTTPDYTWEAVEGATWYYLSVNGPAENVIKQWYAASVVCSGSTCTVTPTTALSAGAHSWWVQTWNNVGYGPWSSRMDFTVP